ncbi:MAG: hypothetical protein IH994_02850 [Proteobacteria bacterium]|nr:hypothetical protein [Pseudomonadota bacterium]
MDSIIESATPWRATTELAVASTAAPEKDPPNDGDVDDDDGFQLFGDDGFTFLDFLDIINPLQHIPIIGTFYREMTGDTLDPGSRVLGGTLFFGPVGTVVSLANVLVDDATGKDMGEHVMAFFENEEPAAQGAEPAGEMVVADIGARAGFVQPETSPAAQSPGGPEALDPVSAWARSEVAFRHSNVGGGRLMLEGEIQDIEPFPAQEKAAAPKLVTTGVLAPSAPATVVAAAVTLAPGWQGVSPYAPVQSAPYAPSARPVALDGPVFGIDALAALRRDLKAGAVKKTAEAAATISETRKTGTASDTPPDTPLDTPPGAVAPLGGWFSETMLSAYGKYQNSANLAGHERPVAIDMTR